MAFGDKRVAHFKGKIILDPDDLGRFMVLKFLNVESVRRKCIVAGTHRSEIEHQVAPLSQQVERQFQARNAAMEREGISVPIFRVQENEFDRLRGFLDILRNIRIVQADRHADELLVDSMAFEE